MANEFKVWGVHTYDDDLFLDDNVIAIGWEQLGDLSLIPADREAMKDAYAEAYPGTKKQGIATSVGMIYRFVYEVQIGDYVVFPSKSDKMINIGIVKGDYYYDDTVDELPNKRKVKWLKHLPRTAFSQGALYEVGSFLTLFMLKNYSDEYMSALDKSFVSQAHEPDETVGATAEEIKQSTQDFILKELSRKFKGYDLEEFVADLLRAMGYRAKVSPQGGDNGVDITAYKDELPPRIIVQVKSGDDKVREATVQSLKGALKAGDYGLFVTLSTFTKNAEKFLEQNPIIKSINGPELVDLILKYYDKLSKKHKSMIPLEMVYIPVVTEDENQ